MFCVFECNTTLFFLLFFFVFLASYFYHWFVCHLHCKTVFGSRETKSAVIVPLHPTHLNVMISGECGSAASFPGQCLFLCVNFLISDYLHNLFNTTVTLCTTVQF